MEAVNAFVFIFKQHIQHQPKPFFACLLHIYKLQMSVTVCSPVSLNESELSKEKYSNLLILNVFIHISVIKYLHTVAINTDTGFVIISEGWTNTNYHLHFALFLVHCLKWYKKIFFLIISLNLEKLTWSKMWQMDKQVGAIQQNFNRLRNTSNYVNIVWNTL